MVVQKETSKPIKSSILKKANGESQRKQEEELNLEETSYYLLNGEESKLISRD